MLNVEEIVMSLRYEQALASGCEVQLEYENELFPINKNRCPYFYGSKEYGNNLSIQLTNESWEQLEKRLNMYFSKNNRLNTFENGTITISKLWYNGRNEEWEEEEIIKFEGKEKEKIISYIDYMLAISPMRRQNEFIGAYKELIEFLKKGNF